MQRATTGDRVTVHYTGTLSDGRTFDSSAEGKPMSFAVGQGEVIKGFEDMVVGMAPGENRRTTIAAEDAYGALRPELVVDVPHDEFPKGISPRAGQLLQIDLRAAHRLDERHVALRIEELPEQTPVGDEALGLGADVDEVAARAVDVLHVEGIHLEEEGLEPWIVSFPASTQSVEAVTEGIQAAYAKLATDREVVVAAHGYGGVFVLMSNTVHTHVRLHQLHTTIYRGTRSSAYLEN